MELENVVKDLNARFAQPLPEFYTRRIIFWNDEDAEFQDKIDELNLDNAKVAVLTGKNSFAVKKLLSHDDLTSNYLVYNPLKTDMEEDWLLDVKLYSEDFRADRTSMLMQEMGIELVPALRNAVMNYPVFLNAVARRKKVASYGTLDTASKVHLAVLAAAINAKQSNPKEIIRTLLMAGRDIENPYKLELIKYDCSDTLWKLVRQTTGFDSSTNYDDMRNHIVLSAASRTLPYMVLAGLEKKYSPVFDGFCYDFTFEWIRNDQDSFYQVVRQVERDLKLRDRFNKFEIKDLVDTELFPCIDEVILSKLMEQVINKSFNADKLISVIQKRRTMAWSSKNECFYNGLYYVACMQKFFEDHAKGFHNVSSSIMWKEYTSDYYKMDTYYRMFHVAFKSSLTLTNSYLDDLFKQVADEIENLYKNWYLVNISNNWTSISQKDLNENGKITGIDQQVDFYKDNVKGKDYKVAVIISDALRYEVAVNLADQLRKETIADVEIDSMQAVYPTITKFGMAALLPKKELRVKDKSGVLRVLADSQNTEMSDRDAILKMENPNSIAIKASDLITLKRDEKRALVKGMDIMYLYHDTIDSTSHSNETDVFVACDTAIKEIKSLVSTLYNDLNAREIIITSDHGFLYTYQNLSEDDKLDRSSFKNHIIEQGRRYVITDNNANPDFLVPVAGFYNDDGYKAFAPRENIRIKGAGGLNFVHGGISLQEMVVPVISYMHYRNDNLSYKKQKDKFDTKPVTVQLLSSSRRISNMIFSLSFYQKEAVNDSNYRSCNYTAYLTDSNDNIVSDIQKIIADNRADAAKDREFKCTFNLKQMKYDSKETYYLVIRDEEGIQIPVKEEMQISIAMAIDDFDF